MSESTFRPLARDDFGTLARWLAAPRVSRWWLSPADAGYVEGHYGPSVDGIKPTELSVIEVDGTAAGMIQRYLLADYPDWSAALGLSDAAGIDYLIGEVEFTGKWLGTQAIREFSALLWERYSQTTAVGRAPAGEHRVMEGVGTRGLRARVGRPARVG